MLMPYSVKRCPEYLESAKQSLRRHDDYVVITQRRFVGRTMSELSENDYNNIIDELATSEHAYICDNRGIAIPPFFAIQGEGPVLSLQGFLCRAMPEKSRMPIFDMKYGCEILAAILSMLKFVKGIEVPRLFVESLGYPLSSENTDPVILSIDDLERIAQTARHDRPKI